MIHSWEVLQVSFLFQRFSEGPLKGHQRHVACQKTFTWRFLMLSPPTSKSPQGTTLSNPDLRLSKLSCMSARWLIGWVTCCFQGNFLGTRQIAFLPLDPEVTRDNAFKVSKALRHPCLKFHLKSLFCYYFYYYYTHCLTSVSYHPSSQAANISICGHRTLHLVVILQGFGCWFPGQAGRAGLWCWARDCNALLCTK